MPNNQGTILVVDDVPTNLIVLMEFLESAGYKVRVATEGKSAIDQTMYAAPDIILLDVMMPGIDGFETCRRLKELPVIQDIPIIFMTALTDIVDKVRGFELGAADYITKPIQMEEVLARVNAHLTLYRQKQEISHLREQDRLHYESLLEMKNEILRTASHDLKNPLSVVMAAVSLSRHYVGKDNERLINKLDHIEDAAHQMRDLLVKLLDLACLETGVGTRRQEVSLQTMLRENAERASSLADMKGIKMRFSTPKRDVGLNCDPAQIDQVLQNLLSNAVKYTPSGGMIKLDAAVKPECVCVRVTDNGLGIPANEVPYVFEKFYRVQTDEHLAVPGTGLGLSIVREIVRQHGGNASVKSKAGRGSMFMFTLPR